MLLKRKFYRSSRLIEAYIYLAYVHVVRPEGDRRYYDLVSDAMGIPLIRDLCQLVYVDSSGKLLDAALWSSDCVAELLWYGGDQDVISQTYIFSWPPHDYVKVSLEDLVEIGCKVARKFFVGHNVLIAAHLDKEHPHIHLCVQNLRTADRDPEPWMETGKGGAVLPSEVKAGDKHHHMPKFENALYNYLLEISREYGLDATDFREKAKENRSEGIERRKEKLMDALDSISREYPRGLEMDKFVSILELHCGAKISIGKNNKLQLKFGSKGKAYPLGMWGVTPDDIYGVLRPSMPTGKETPLFGPRDWQVQKVLDGLAIAAEEGISTYNDALNAAELSAREMRFFRDCRDGMYARENELRPEMMLAKEYIRAKDQIYSLHQHGVDDNDETLLALIDKKETLHHKLNRDEKDIHDLIDQYNRTLAEIDRCDKRLRDERKRYQKLKALQESTQIANNQGERVNNIRTPDRGR